MKIIFVNPIAKFHKDRFSIGTVILSTILRNIGYDVEIVDFDFLCHQGVFDTAAFEEEDLHTFGSYLLGKSPGIISFYTMCNSYHMSVITAKYIKEKKPDVFISMGGPQASASAVESMQSFPWIDLIGLGEGEKTIVDIIKAIQGEKDFSKISGVCYRGKNSIYIRENNEIVDDLDQLPMLDYGLVPNMNSKEYISIEVGRGCPFACRYCSTKSFWKRRYRVKSAERIIEEVKYLKTHYDIHRFTFVHDLFTVNKKKIIEFCDQVIAEKVNISWSCSSRVDTLDEEIISKMKTAGCNAIYLGIETGSKDMQKSINKNLNLDKMWDNIRLLKKYDIKMKVSFIYGFPGETLDDLKQTLATIVRLMEEGVKDVQLHKLSILSGTEFYDSYYKDLSITQEFSFSDVNGGGSSQTFKEFLCSYPKIFPSFFGIRNVELAEADMLDTFIYHYYSLISKRFQLTYHYLMAYYQKDLYLFYKDFKKMMDEKRRVIYEYTDFNNLDNIGFTDEIIKSIEAFVEENSFGKLDVFIKNIFRFERDFNRFVYFNREEKIVEKSYDFDILSVKRDMQPASCYKSEDIRIRLIRDNDSKIKIQRIERSFAG